MSLPVIEPTRPLCRCGVQSRWQRLSWVRGWGVALLTVGLLVAAARLGRGQEATGEPVAETAADTKESLTAIREHLQKGRYAEGAEACAGLPDEVRLSPEVTIPWSQCLEEQGELEGANRVVTEALAQQAGQAQLLGRLAELQYRRGDFTGCATTLELAFQAEPE